MLEQQAEQMRTDWDRRARENARHFIVTSQDEWSDAEFFASGMQTAQEEILTDMTNICQGKPPKEMRILEIGCGAGRVTRSLAQIFGEVHAVDVSGEMIAQAKASLRAFPNAHVYRNNGMDLSVVPDLAFDFAFSFIVFQHIPSLEIVESYLREVHRLVRPGCLFKFQVNGIANEGRLAGALPACLQSNAPDTWLGAPMSEADAMAMAERTGWECRHRIGADTQFFWLWYFRKAT